MSAREVAVRVNELAPRLLKGLAPSEVAVVLESATLQRFCASSTLANEGYGAGHLYLLLKGAARTFTMTRKGDKVILFWIRPGEFAGGRALLREPTKYLVTTETVTETVALMWRRDDALSLGARFPRLIENALLIASDYVESYRDLHVSASFDSAGQRVARVLDELSEGIGEEGPEGTLVQINNEELANEANVTIFTVSRLLSDWQRKGFVKKSRGSILVRMPKKLMRKVG